MGALRWSLETFKVGVVLSEIRLEAEHSLMDIKQFASHLLRGFMLSDL